MINSGTPDQVTTDAALLLLKLAGATSTFEASHAAAAFQRHRREMRLEGSNVPASLEVLEAVFATVSLGSRRVTAGQVGAELRPDQDGGQRDHRDENEGELLTRAQAARRLRCSVSTIKRRERSGELRPVRHGRVVRHRRTDLDSFLDGE